MANTAFDRHLGPFRLSALCSMKKGGVVPRPVHDIYSPYRSKRKTITCLFPSAYISLSSGTSTVSIYVPPAKLPPERFGGAAIRMDRLRGLGFLPVQLFSAARRLSRSISRSWASISSPSVTP